MPLTLFKASPQSLRSLGFDEKWLQARIDEDPLLLGLGDLEVLSKERRQVSKGRIDFLLRDPVEGTRYEVELMLGTLDESHIIRTIEYWDLERQRYPTYDHRAVIVAEEITARFFNVIRLLNRAVPLIAIQLSSFAIDDRVVLHFTKVLDIYQEQESEDDIGGEGVDRAAWERKTNPQSLAVLDKVVALVESAIGNTKVTYNKHHIALNAGSSNFAWFYPRKEAAHCHIELWTGADAHDEIVAELQNAGLPTFGRKSDGFNIRITTAEFERHLALLTKILRRIADISAS